MSGTPTYAPEIFYIGYGIYIGRKEDANELKELKDRHISHVLTLGKGSVPNNKNESTINYHLFDIEDNPGSPWGTFLTGRDDPCAQFIENFRAKPTNRLFVHCTEARLRAPFAVRCILIKFFNYTPFQARIRLTSIYPRFYMYVPMFKAELDLCSRADKDNDFGLRKYLLEFSKAPDDEKPD